ncbi:hypothetical protein C0J52_09570 [Blattella germanica]|nr:hypothetical protein C0J52_09570 [Blattella germanica]
MRLFIQSSKFQNDVDTQRNGTLTETTLGVVPFLGPRPTRVWPEELGKTDQNAGNTLTVQHDGGVIVLSKVDAETVGHHPREDCQDILLMVELKYKDVPEPQQTAVAKTPTVTYAVDSQESIICKAETQTFASEGNKVQSVTYTSEVPTVSSAKTHTLAYTIDPQVVSSPKTYTLTYTTDSQSVMTAKTQSISYPNDTQPITVSKIQTFSYTTDAVNKPQTVTYTTEPPTDKTHALVYATDTHPVSLTKAHSLEFTGNLQTVALTKAHMLSYTTEESNALTGKTHLLAYTAEPTNGEKTQILAYSSEQTTDDSKNPTLTYSTELQPSTLVTKTQVLGGAADVQVDENVKSATLAFPAESEEILQIGTNIPQQTALNIDSDKYKASIGEENAGPPRPEKPFPCTVCGKSFMRRTNLNAHMGVRHTQSYGDKAMLQKHLKSHSEHKPYSCDICGKSFHFQWYLTTHKKTHIDEGSFNCGQCGKVFNKKGNLQSHAKCHPTDNNVGVKTNIDSTVMTQENSVVEVTL